MQIQVHRHGSDEVELIEVEETVLVREILVRTRGAGDDVLWLEEMDELIELDITVVMAGIKHGHHIHRGPREVTIIVNGREKSVPQRPLTFEHIVHLAFDTPPTGANVVFTITYRHGRDGASGSLTAGETVRPRNGMIFNVTATDKS